MVCNRGPFELIECWIENRQLIEFTTPEMTSQYLWLFSSSERNLNDEPGPSAPAVSTCS